MNFRLQIFKNNTKFSKNIFVENNEVIDEIKKNLEPVIFVSGHFNNFELMAMQLELFGIKLSTIYRPLNNIFLNETMEDIRKKYICKNQIKKGIAGTKLLLSYFKKNYSIALMVDQRVSQSIKSNFFHHEAYTTTIPAQFVKKFNCKIVPVHIKRKNDDNFKLKIFKSLNFSNNQNIDAITLTLNSVLEKMIVENPGQWIWTHNRWK